MKKAGVACAGVRVRAVALMRTAAARDAVGAYTKRARLMPPNAAECRLMPSNAQ